MTREKGAGLLVVAVLAGLIALPLVAGADLERQAGRWIMLVVATAGASMAMRGAGLPLLSQGGFMAAGAYAAAVSRTRWGWDPLASIGAAVVVAGGCGLAVGHALRRLRPVFVAGATWLLAWVATLALGAFPWLTGGSAGLVLPPARIDVRAVARSVVLDPAGRYLVAVGLAAVTLGLLRLATGRFGPVLAAVRDDPAAARAAGLRVEALRRGALAGAAATAGVAGAGIALLSGIADPTAFGALLSGQLFVAALVAGGTGAGAAAVGVLVLQTAGDLVGAVFGQEPAVADPLAAAAVGALALVAGRTGWPAPVKAGFRRLGATPTAGPEPAAPLGAGEPGPATAGPALRRGPGNHERAPAATPRGAPAGPDDGLPAVTDGNVARSSLPNEPPAGAAIDVRDLAVRFGEVTALDGLTLTIPPGGLVGIVGSNGSGKTTLLRCLSGAVTPTSGSVRIGTGASQARVTRTLPRPTFGDRVTPFEHLLASTEPARDTGLVAALLLTPGARAEQRAVTARAAGLLAAFGLAGQAHTPLGQLDGFAQRRLQLAAAIASQPDVVLLDEPSAGLGRRETEELATLLADVVSGEGRTVLLVEHNLRLVRAVCERVIVFDQGRVLADGTPADALADAAVARSYLGTAS